MSDTPLVSNIIICAQAAAAVIRAYEAGLRRQKVELLLPQAGTTSAQGSWPGGIRQQAQVAIPSMIEPLLKQLKQHPNLQVRVGLLCMLCRRFSFVLNAP